jgi:hypothetical protein
MTRPTAVRAAVHVHSSWSDDGSRSLPQIAATFGRLGYDVVLMSEHSRGFSPAKWDDYNAACAAASTRRVRLVPGIEYGDADDVVHIPAWGAALPFFGDGLPIGELLAAVTGSGGAAMWAHPFRKGAYRRFEPAWLGHLIAVEVWNRKYDGIAPRREAVALARRERLRPAVALDYHTTRQLFPLSLTLTLEAGATCTADAVYAALIGGRLAPRLLGLPVETFLGGPAEQALHGLERIRRTAARALR